MLEHRGEKSHIQNWERIRFYSLVRETAKKGSTPWTSYDMKKISRIVVLYREEERMYLQWHEEIAAKKSLRQTAPPSTASAPG